MSENKNSYMVFSGTATKYLAEKICQSLGCPLGQLQITKFSDGEFPMRKAFVGGTSSSYRAPSPTATT